MLLSLRRTRGGSVRRLFAVYALVSLLPVLALGAVLLTLTQRQATSQGLAQGRSEASLFARTVVAPILGNRELSSGLAPSERHTLGRSVSTAIRDGQILRLRLRTLSGAVVWSSDPGAISSPTDDDATEAAAGHPVSHITRLNADDDSDDAAPGVDAAAAGPRVAETYVPIVSAEQGRRLGVLEVYLPYGPIARDVSSGQRTVTVSLTLGLIVLWLGLLGVSASVTRRLRRIARDNEYLAGHDVLTGLPNRAEFARQAQQTLGAASLQRPVAVVVIDLDRFKEVNDTLGHVNGDRLLVQLTRRLRANLRDRDMVARLGGDEFGLILTDVHGPSETVEVLQRLRKVLSEPLSLDGLPLAIEASIGFALSPTDAVDIDSLMTHADVAMYVAKQRHLGVVHYQRGHDQYDAGALSLIAELGAAIENDELVLHYQPKSDIRSGDVTAVEALVRWQHPVRGLLYPDAFLIGAEQTELVEPLTRWVLRRAMATLPSLDPSGELVIAVNVSARNLTRLEFVDDVTQALADTGIDPSRLILEVTETALVADPERAAMTLNRLHSCGIRVSIDDFGAGQTSLGYLARLPVAELKIDKTFVLAMTRDPRQAAIVRSVIELGHSLGFTVTAEGVEDQHVLDVLSAAHCDLAQGYHLARPMPADELRALLRRLRPSFWGE